MRYEIDTDALQRDIGELQSLLQSLRGQLKKLDGSMQILNQTWEGTAKEAYMTEYREDLAAMEELCNMIFELIQIFSSAKDEYMNKNNAAQTRVAQIRV